MAHISPISRRTFVWGGVSAGALGVAAPGISLGSRQPHDLATWDLEGRGWAGTETPFDRLPARARERVRPPVWSLSQHTAGISARFRSDAPSLHFRVSLRFDSLDMVHMPATGVSGIDLYGRHEGEWCWIACGQPRARDYELRVSGLREGRREYVLYLPLYNGVQSLSLEVPEGASVEPLPSRPQPVVYYGTSITQGACASRPGMAFTNILARRMERPFLNLGFSGNGRMEPELGELLGELDAACYVIDCLPNLKPDAVAERTGPLVRGLRRARPETPILLVEDRRMPDARLRPERGRFHDANQAALRTAFEALQSDGVQGLHYLEDLPLLGPDGEATVDASHPTDVGMLRYATCLEARLRPLLKATGER